jgi:hypothetical protein
MPVLNVGERLTSMLGRIDLAADVIGVMVHPGDKTARSRRRSALAMTCLGKSDRDDEPDAVSLVEFWFQKSGGFKTASRSHPYDKQQRVFLKQFPQILSAGSALHLVWSMNAHHGNQLRGGASLGKAIAVMLSYPAWLPNLSERGLWSAWSRHKSASALCAAFTSAIHEAFRAPPGEIDERLKIAYVQDLHLTLALAAAYERFGSSFRPHGSERPLLAPASIWQLRGIEADMAFLPPPLPSEMLTVAQNYRAAVNIAYR